MSFVVVHYEWNSDCFCIYRFGTKRVKANQVYQEYIQDKHHLHMNSTRWVTLTEFIKHLGRTGVAKVDDTEKGWFIAWIDSSPKALAKAVRYHSANLVLKNDMLTYNITTGGLNEERPTNYIRRAARAYAHC